MERNAALSVYILNKELKFGEFGEVRMIMGCKLQIQFDSIVISEV